MEMKVSAVVIAKDAGKVISNCLKSLMWTDEILLIDNLSDDDTVIVARKLGAKIYSKEGSFASLRNEGAKLSKGSWLLYVDTDEIIPPPLRKEIKSTIQNEGQGFTAFAIPRRNILLGREMHFGGWRPDYVIRLIKKDALIRWEGELHEQPRIRGKLGKLKNSLIHRTHADIESMIEKSNKWTEIEAKLIFRSNHPEIKLWRFSTIAIREFWNRAIRNLGFLDGVEGLIEIFFQVFNKFIIYAKVWELQEEKKQKNA